MLLFDCFFDFCDQLALVEPAQAKHLADVTFPNTKRPEAAAVATLRTQLQLSAVTAKRFFLDLIARIDQFLAEALSKGGESGLDAFELLLERRRRIGISTLDCVL